MEVFNLNIIPGAVAPIIHASQYDEEREFRANLFEGDQVFELTGEEIISVNVRKTDGNVVTAAVVNTGANYVDFSTTLQMTACAGANLCQLRIENSPRKIGTLNFILAIERDPLEGGIQSESEIHNLETQVAGMVAEDVAEQYDSGNVIFDNEPTSGHGTPYTVTSEGIKNAIDNAFDYDNTASGSLVHIEDGADNIPVKSLVSQITAVESGSGEKSPTNPYAISGFDSGIITRLGKNLIDDSKYYQLNANIVVVGQTETNANRRVYLPKGTYTIKVTSSVSATIYYDFGSGSTSLGNTTEPRTFTLSENSYCSFWLYKSGGFTPSDYTAIQLEVGDTTTTYEAYNGNTYTFTFGQTVYGGHFDNKGNLVVTHIGVDMGDFDWTYLAVDDFYVFGYRFGDKALTHNEMCECYTVTAKSRQSLLNHELGTYNLTNALNYVVIRDDDYSNANDFKTAVTGQKLVYELATPITLAITSQDIPTLLGENNIFSNCGDVEVTYYTNKANDILDFINSEIDKKNGTNIPIEENSQDSIKDYIDNVSLSGLPDTDISGETSGQILAYDGAKWVNANQIVVKYEEKDIAFDSSGEGTLYFANGYILGLKDIPSDSLYIGYITYMAGTKTMVKGFNRSVTGFDSSSIASTTRKIGIYYLDYITTQ